MTCVQRDPITHRKRWRTIPQSCPIMYKVDPPFHTHSLPLALASELHPGALWRTAHSKGCFHPHQKTCRNVLPRPVYPYPPSPTLSQQRFEIQCCIAAVRCSASSAILPSVSSAVWQAERNAHSTVGSQARTMSSNVRRLSP